MSSGRSVLTAMTSLGISSVIAKAITFSPTSAFVFLRVLLASSIEELVYEDANGNLVNEDLTNKKTLVVFWADY